jgi:hypothetical protein
MFSQSPGIYILLGSVLSAILSSVISGIMLLTGNYFNNKSQLKREEQQHIWQVEREKQQRIWQEESDKRKWEREKISDSYKKLIQVLTNIIQIQVEIRDNDAVNENEYNNLRNLCIEFGSEFTIIMTGHPEKNSKGFEEKKVKIFSEALDLDKDPWLAREMIAKLMDNDSRINIINNT